VIVCSDHTVIDRLCVKRRLGALVSSLWLVLVQKHICVLGLFLPSFRYIFCIHWLSLLSYVICTFHLEYIFLEILDWWSLKFIIVDLTTSSSLISSQLITESCSVLHCTAVLAVRWYCGRRCELWPRLVTVQWSELWHVNSLQSLCWEIGDKSRSPAVSDQNPPENTPRS